MAKARKVKVERIVEEEGVELHLTMAEARTLYAITMRVGGAPNRSPRGHADAVREAIRVAVGPDAAVDFYDTWANPEFALLSGGPGLSAKDYPEEGEADDTDW